MKNLFIITLIFWAFVSYQVKCQDMKKAKITYMQTKILNQKAWSGWSEKQTMDVNAEIKPSGFIIHTEEKQTYKIVNTIEAEPIFYALYECKNEDNKKCNVSFYYEREKFYIIVSFENIKTKYELLIE